MEQAWNWLWKQFSNPWVLFGFAAQFVFFLRFAVQWFESEKRGHSHIPVAFWWLSIVGGVMILIYAAVKTQDIVFVTAQILSLVIYIRNLMLIYRPRKAPPPAFAPADGVGPAAARSAE